MKLRLRKNFLGGYGLNGHYLKAIAGDFMNYRTLTLWSLSFENLKRGTNNDVNFAFLSFQLTFSKSAAFQ